MPNLQLEGKVDDHTDYLEDELLEARRKLREAQIDIDRLTTELQKYRRAIKALQDQLSPLRRAILSIFGEIDLVAEPESATTVTGFNNTTVGVMPQVAIVWEEWKRKLGPTCAKFIDALLLHRELNADQLAVITGCGRSNVTKYIYKLNQANLTNKAGDKFSLKQI